MNGTNDRPKVSVNVLILKDGKVLMTKRKGSLGAGEYGFPGGHLEHMESFEDCVRRETREECGLEIENIRFGYVLNTMGYAPKHYVHIGMTADWASGEPRLLEPEKAEGWQWYDIDSMPTGKECDFCRRAIDAYRTGRIYYASDIES